jgi:hypothetical protein
VIAKDAHPAIVDQELWDLVDLADILQSLALPLRQ